ncbi:T9SS type A sorting domain-containing protein, partial [Gelidibacter sp.]|uniref:T9SS type A sorting domain-containing protein n=1 Tax=Gelidibacter sp. TaxID=2018083 RepID=UPI0032671CBF
YTVTAYDSTGKNSAKAEVTVKVNPLPIVNAGSNVTINSGESTTLTATGGTTYKWSTGATTASITVRPTATQTYTVIGTKNGCEATSTVKVTVLNPIGVTANAGADQSICAGTSTTLTASGGSTYLWSTGAKTASITVSPNQTTTYTVTAYDSTGKNSDTDEVKVTVNALPRVDAGSNVTINSGESTTLTATGGTTYKWSTGATTTSITVRPTASQTYTVTGTSNGCEATDTVRVTVVNPVGVTADAGADQSICAGTSATLTATGGSTYLWSTGAKTASITVSPNQTMTYTVTAFDSTGKNSAKDDVTVKVNPLPVVDAGNNVTITSGESATLTATGATTYKWSTGATGATVTVRPTASQTYTVTGISNGCEATDTVRVTVVNPVGVTADAGADQTICAGTSVTLTATGGSSYLWSNGAKTASITVKPNATTTYTVTAYDSTGANSDTDAVKVTVNPLPKVDAGNNITINAGESATLTATGATTYKWSTGATGATVTVRPTASQTYTVTGISNGCEATDTVNVTVVNPQVVVARAGGNQNICEGSSVTLTATGGDHYVWSNGAKTASITVNPKYTTKYSVTAYVGNVSGTDEAVVNVNPNPNVKITNGSEASILEGEFITLSATGAKTYKWNNGATQPNIAVRPNATQTFSVTGYDNKCAAERSIKVSVFEKIVADAGSDVTIYRNEKTVLTAKGPKNSEFLWSTGETTRSITVSPLEDTEYSVMVYHDLDSDTANVTVKVIDLVDDNIMEDSAPLEFLIHPNPTDGELNIKISGLTNLSSIHLYDLSGKSLYNEIINESDHQSYNKKLNLSNYASGVYLLQLVDNQRVITKKVVVR